MNEYDSLYQKQESKCEKAYIDGRESARRGESNDPPEGLGDTEKICWKEGYNDVLTKEWG